MNYNDQAGVKFNEHHCLSFSKISPKVLIAIIQIFKQFTTQKVHFIFKMYFLISVVFLEK